MKSVPSSLFLSLIIVICSLLCCVPLDLAASVRSRVPCDRPGAHNLVHSTVRPTDPYVRSSVKTSPATTGDCEPPAAGIWQIAGRVCECADRVCRIPYSVAIVLKGPTIRRSSQQWGIGMACVCSAFHSIISEHSFFLQSHFPGDPRPTTPAAGTAQPELWSGTCTSTCEDPVREAYWQGVPVSARTTISQRE